MKPINQKSIIFYFLFFTFSITNQLYAKDKLLKYAERLDLKSLEKEIKKGRDPNAISKDKRFFTRKLIGKTPLMAIFTRENLWMWKFGKKFNNSSMIYITEKEKRSGSKPLEKKRTKNKIDEHVKKVLDTVDLLIAKGADINKKGDGEYKNKTPLATLLSKLNYSKKENSFVLGATPSGLYKPRYCTKYIDVKLIHGLVLRGVDLDVKVDIQKNKKKSLSNMSTKTLLQKKWFNPVIKHAILEGSQKKAFLKVHDKFPLKTCTTEIRGGVENERQSIQYLSYYCLCPPLGVSRFLKDNSKNPNEKAKPTF